MFSITGLKNRSFVFNMPSVYGEFHPVKPGVANSNVI